MEMRFVYFILWAAVLAGCAGHDDSSSSATDTHAGLTELGNTICSQTKNGLMWQVDRSPAFSSWKEASQYADSLDLGGFTDWRLPTRDELYDLHDIFERKDNGLCVINRQGSYWSGVVIEEASAGRWESYPLCGGSEYRYVKKSKGFVRAVRP